MNLQLVFLIIHISYVIMPSCDQMEIKTHNHQREQDIIMSHHHVISSSDQIEIKILRVW